jgi:predicted dehydrogenase
MGANHGRVARTLSDFRVTSVCDGSAERATALAASVGAKATTDVDEAIAAADAVVLATPSDTHAEIGERILRAGRDLLVEKPIATTVDDAQRLIDVADQHDRVLMIGHIERFNPVIMELDNLINNLISVDISRLGPFTKRVLADVVLDLMIHDVDLARSIAGGEIVEHHSMTRSVRTSEPDLASALLRFDNGVLATITSSRISQNKVRRLTLTQRDNTVVADLLRQQVEVHRIEHSEYLDEGGVRYRQSGLVEIPFLSQQGEPLALELRHFARCIIDRTRPKVSGEDGLAALRVCLELRDAAIAG